MVYSKEEYEKEPVHYCASCLSLNVKELNDVKLDICGECGNTDIKMCSLERWNELYTDEYGKAFLTEDEDEE